MQCSDQLPPVYARKKLGIYTLAQLKPDYRTLVVGQKVCVYTFARSFAQAE